MVSLAAPCEDEVRGMCILDPLGIDEVDGGTLRMERFDLGVGSLRDGIRQCRRPYRCRACPY